MPRWSGLPRNTLISYAARYHVAVILTGTTLHTHSDPHSDERTEPIRVADVVVVDVAVRVNVIRIVVVVRGHHFKIRTSITLLLLVHNAYVNIRRHVC